MTWTVIYGHDRGCGFIVHFKGNCLMAGSGKSFTFAY